MEEAKIHNLSKDENVFLISILASKMGQIKKINTHYYTHFKGVFVVILATQKSIFKRGQVDHTWAKLCLLSVTW